MTTLLVLATLLTLAKPTAGAETTAAGYAPTTSVDAAPLPSAPVSPPVPESTPAPENAPSPMRPPACLELSPSAYTHDGFYLRFSLGVAYGSIVGSGPSGRTSLSGLDAATTLLVGGTPARGLVVGGAIHSAGASGQLEGGPLDGYHVTGAAIAFGPFLDWYPDPRDGWHVGLLAGIGGAQLSNAAVSLGSTGAAAALLTGYDWWIGPQWSLGILATASAATSGRLKYDDRSDSGYRVTPLAFTLEASLTLH
jgi:hypothetical protein